MVWPSTNPIKFLIRRVSLGSPPSTRIFVFGLFVSMLFTSKDLFFLFEHPLRDNGCALQYPPNSSVRMSSSSIPAPTSIFRMPATMAGGPAM